MNLTKVVAAVAGVIAVVLVVRGWLKERAYQREVNRRLDWIAGKGAV